MSDDDPFGDLPPSEVLDKEVKALIAEYNFLTDDMRRELQDLLETLDAILLSSGYKNINGMPKKQYDEYVTAFDNMNQAISGLREYARNSKIEELKTAIQEEQQNFMERVKPRKGSRPKNHAAHDAAIHIGFFLRDTVGLKKFSYYLKQKRAENLYADFALKLFDRYGYVDGHDSALKFVKDNFDKIDRNSLKIR